SDVCSSDLRHRPIRSKSNGILGQDDDGAIRKVERIGRCLQRRNPTDPDEDERRLPDAQIDDRPEIDGDQQAHDSSGNAAESTSQGMRYEVRRDGSVLTTHIYRAASPSRYVYPSSPAT